VAGRVKAATAYIDIRLGSFQEFKQAAEAKAKQVGQSVAKKMGDEITKNISGKNAGNKLGQEVVQSGTQKMGSLRSLWNNESVKAARESSAQFAKTFGLGLQAAGMGDFRFLTAAAKTAASQAGSALKAGFQAMPAVFRSIGTAAKSAFSGIGNVMSGLGTVASKLNAGLAQVSKGFETFGRKVGFASFMVQGLGYDLLFLATVPAAAAATAIGVFGLKFGANLEQARFGLAAVLGSMQAAQKETEILAKIAQESPAFDTTSILNYAKSLLNAGLSVDKTNKLFMASSNIFTSLGLSVDQANGAFYAITQIMQKGTAQSEELSQQLAERGVPIWKILSDQLGVTQSKLKDMVKEGKITSDIFVDAMIKAGNSGKYMTGAGLAADSVVAKFANLKEQIQYKLAVAFEKNLFPVLGVMIDKYGPQIIGSFDTLDKKLSDVALYVVKVSEGIDAMTGKWKSLDDETKKNIINFFKFLIAAGPTILLMTKVGSALAGLASAIALLTNPVGLVVLALIAVGIALYAFRKPIQDFFQNTEQGRAAVQNMKDALKSFVDFWNSYIAPILSYMGKAVSEAFKGFFTGKGDVGKISGDFAKLRELINGLVKDLKGNFKDAADKVKSSFADLGIKIDFVKFALGSLQIGIKTFLAIFSLIVAVVSAVVGTVVSLVGSLIRVITDILVGGFNFIVGTIRFFKDLFTGEWGKLGADLKQLWDGLWMLIVGTIWDAIMGIIDAVVALVKPIIKWFKYLYDILVGHSIVPDLINAIIAWFVSLPGKIMGTIISMVNAVVGYFADLARRAVGAVQNLANEVAAKIRGVGTAVANAASGFGSLLVNSGREIIDGLINGIEQKLGALKNKLSGVASTIASFFPGSPVKQGPLRVLNNGHVGKTIIDMIASGMAETQPVQLAALNASSAIANNLVGANGASPAALVGTVAPNENANGGLTINQEVNVPAAITDPADIADYSTRRLVSALTTKATS